MTFKRIATLWVCAAAASACSKKPADAEPDPALGDAKLKAQPAPGGSVDPGAAAKLQIDVQNEGTGPGAKPGDRVVVNYTGTLANGLQFDSSRDPGRQPLSFTLGAPTVIPGWTSGLQGMKAGGKRKLTVPAHLGYGARAKPNIPPNSTLIFEIEMIEVVPGGAPPAPLPTQAPGPKK